VQPGFLTKMPGSKHGYGKFPTFSAESIVVLMRAAVGARQLSPHLARTPPRPRAQG
jgi:hypothetical protein